MLAGILEPDHGIVEVSSANIRIGFLQQDIVEMLNSSRTLEEEIMSAFTAENALLQQIESTESEIEAAASRGDDISELMDTLMALQSKARVIGANNLKGRVMKIMDRMGFGVKDRSALISTFSGGWRMRIGLAKVLSQDP